MRTSSIKLVSRASLINTKFIFNSFTKNISFHIVILYSIYSDFTILEFFQSLPNNTNLVQYDVYWYKSIINEGYKFSESTQSNLAFFPLFAYFWKVIDSSPLGICVINYSLTLLAFAILYNAFKLKQKEILLALSIPSIVFCYIPYSEAFFFLFSSMIIWGFQRNNNWIVAVGLFLSCMTRSVSITYVPLLVFFTFLQLNHRKENNIIQIKWSLIFILSSLLALFLTFYIQYLATGQFFAMFQIQKHWGKKFHLPGIIDTWWSLKLMWIDGIATLVGIFSTLLCLNFFIRKLIQFKIKRNKVIVFSLSYLSLATLTNLFYSSLIGDSVKYTIHSMNRYVLCTSFFTIFLIIVPRLIRPNHINNLSFGIITGLSLFWLSITELMNGLSLTTLNYYAILFILLIAYYFPNIRGKYWQILYSINIILQLYLLNRFINAYFIG